ncbi:unnamed protein product [Cunninghamella blakesleeana]
MKVSALTVLVSLVSATFAFENTVPCVMWSSKNYLSQPHNNQLVINKNDASSTILDSLSSNICNSKLIAVINQPGLHCSDLASLNTIKEHNQVASSHAQIEYIMDGVDVEALAKAIDNQCGDQTESKVYQFDLPENAKENENKLDELLNGFKETSEDDYVIIYTSNEPKKMPLRRRAPSDNLPIFMKYQLFTPAIITSLAVAFLFLFITATGITWLIGIQTPIRFEGKQKKN